MNLLLLRSSFQTDDFVKQEYAELLKRLQTVCNADIQIIGEDTVETHSFASQPVPDAVMIATGGVENLFKTLWPRFDVEAMCAPIGPKTVTLIADGRNNSLAAALEILTYLGNNGMEGRILHGTTDDIVETLQVTSLLKGTRIGLFGKPSDWLIASDVDRDYLRKHFGVATVDIDLQRLIEGIKEIPQKEAIKISQVIVKRSEGVKEPSCADMVEASKAYLALKKICQEERLDAMTIRCFDIVKACGTTSCLALALLNDEGIVSGCEGDMQTLMTMLLVKRLCGMEAFMANPSTLTDTTTMLAHCTIPLNLCEKNVIRSHFESSIGVAIQGVMPLQDYTIVKWGGSHLDQYFVAEAQAIEAPYSDHFCRTQITLNLNMKDYLLQRPIGNHHVIVPGRHRKVLEDFFSSLKAKD